MWAVAQQAIQGVSTACASPGELGAGLHSVIHQYNWIHVRLYTCKAIKIRRSVGQRAERARMRGTVHR